MEAPSRRQERRPGWRDASSSGKSSSLAGILDKRLRDLFELNAHLLDPMSFTTTGPVEPHALPPLSEGIGSNPFAGLIHIREINAQRGFADAGDSNPRLAADSR